MEPPRIVALIISNVESVKQWTNIKQITSFQKGLIKVDCQKQRHKGTAKC